MFRCIVVIVHNYAQLSNKQQKNNIFRHCHNYEVKKIAAVEIVK